MEAPIIRTCSLALIAAALVAAPAGAAAVSDPPQRLDLLLKARAAEATGERHAAAMAYAAMVEAGVADERLAATAMTQAIGVGDFALADRLVRVAPQYRAAYNMDGRLYLLVRAIERGEAKGDYTDALALLAEDARVSFDFIGPFVRAWTEIASDRPATQEHGLSYLTDMTTDMPLRVHADEQLGYMLLTLGRPTEAMAHIERAVGRAGGREAAVRLNFADGLAHVGAKDEAVALLAGRDPILVNARARIAAGKSLGMRVTTPSEGIAEFLLALSIQLNNASDPRLPLSFGQLARAVDGDQVEAALITALLLDGEGRTDEALELMRALDPEGALGPQLRDTELQMLLNADRTDEALAITRRDVKSHSDQVGVWARHGDALSAAERWAEAADAYARERALQPENWTIMFLEAVAHNEAGDWETSKTLLNGALAQAPNQPVILNYLGYISLEKGEDLERADALIRAASALAPKDPSITDSLGWAYYKLGRYDEAVETLARAAKLDPVQAEIHEHHGDALWKAGRPIEARFAWTAAQTTAEEEDRIARLDDKLLHGLTDANTAP